MRNYGGATYLVLPDGAAILGILGLLRPLRSLLSLLALSPFALSLPLLFLVVLGSHIDDYALFSSHLFASSIDIYSSLRRTFSEGKHYHRTCRSL